MSLITNLNKKFTEKFGKTLAELNKGVYIAALQDDGNYEAPTITVAPLGGTVNPEKDEAGNLKLNPAAPATVVMKKKKPINVFYKLMLNRAELEITDKNDAYFDYFFTNLLKVALSNYRATVGSPEDVRFGSYYIKAELKKPTGADLDRDSESIILELSGSWASEEQVVNE